MSKNIFQLKYQKDEQHLCWPISEKRLSTLYRSVGRAIKVKDGQDDLLMTIKNIANEWDEKCKSDTKSQELFRQWFFQSVKSIISVDFLWESSNKTSKYFGSNPTFGMAQKFITLVIKDWWAISDDAEKSDCTVLYAPFDRIMGEAIKRYTNKEFDCLKPRQGGYLFGWDNRDEFMQYQQCLNSLSTSLQEKLALKTPLIRLELEQLIWGWI